MHMQKVNLAQKKIHTGNKISITVKFISLILPYFGGFFFFTNHKYNFRRIVLQQITSISAVLMEDLVTAFITGVYTSTNNLYDL